MADAIDLENYFDRVGYRGPHASTEDVLHGLTQAHAQSIPYENIDMLLGRPIRLDPADLYRKLVIGGRGGHCLEQNGLLMEVLARLGFTVRPVRAAIRLGESDRRAVVGHMHLVLKVRIRHESWITDVGLGAASLTSALRLTAGLEQQTPHETRRLEQENGRWFHQIRYGNAWLDVYEFNNELMPLPDRVVANWYASTHPDSTFRQGLFVSKALPDGKRVSLCKNNLTVRETGGSAQKQTISDPNQLLGILREHFGIDLPEGTRFEQAAETLPV